MKKMLWVVALLSMQGDLARAQPVAVAASGLGFPEGTIFVGDILYFVDYAASDVQRLVDGRVERVWHQDGCGANGLVATGEGVLVACFDSGALVMISPDGKTLETIVTDAAGHRFVAPNDLAADGHGGVFFTASGAKGLVPGKVFHRGADHRVTEVASGIDFANGLVVSPDGRRLYVAETPTGRLLEFNVADDGTLSGRRIFVTLADILAPGHGLCRPDGVRIDWHGNLFVALYDGGGVAVIGPDGRLLRQIEIASAHHTNLAISPDGQSLYVTAVDDAPDGSYRGQIVRVVNPIGG